MVDRRRYSSGTTWEGRAGYSRAVRVGDWVLVAGTTAGLSEGGVTSSDPRLQTLEALRRTREALAALGASLDDVVRTRLYVTDADKWEPIADAHNEVLGHIRPVTSMVEVSRLIDPEMVVEVEVEAYTGR
jgi:enamine deaminase RidA (YjgF/YER057c/UK114 family)